MDRQDLTKGPVFSTMSLFALPMICGNILQQGYNIVDTWVVGHMIGPDALAAVGAAFALMTFLTSILLGLCMGSGTVFSLCFGRQDKEGLKDSVCASFLLLFFITALLTAGALLSVDALMIFLNIPGQITAITREYLVLVFWGIPAVALYNFFAAYLKAVGNSMLPLVFLGISTISNIGLDLAVCRGVPSGDVWRCSGNGFVTISGGVWYRMLCACKRGGAARCVCGVLVSEAKPCTDRELFGIDLYAAVGDEPWHFDGAGIGKQLWNSSDGGICGCGEDRSVYLYAGAGIRQCFFYVYRAEYWSRKDGTSATGYPMRGKNSSFLLLGCVFGNLVMCGQLDAHIY